MLRIAICDDELLHCAYTAQMIERVPEYADAKSGSTRIRKSFWMTLRPSRFLRISRLWMSVWSK